MPDFAKDKKDQQPSTTGSPLIPSEYTTQVISSPSSPSTQSLLSPPSAQSSQTSPPAQTPSLLDHKDAGWQQTRAAYGGLAGLLDTGTQNGKLKTVSLGSTFKDEDKKAGWRSGLSNFMVDDKDLPAEQGEQGERVSPESQAFTTYYFSDKDRADSKLSIGSGGALTGPGGRLFDTTRVGNKMHIDRAGEPEVGFVLAPSGSMHAFHGGGRKGPDGRKRFLHHSSPLAGGDVAGAGTLSATDGVITGLSDQSGHYRPSAELTHQTVRHLADSGAAMERRVGIDKEGKEVAADSKEAVQAGPKSAQVTLVGKEGGERDLTLRYQQFLQTGGNERQARHKLELNKEIAEHGAFQERASDPRVFDEPGRDQKDATGLYASMLPTQGPQAPYTSLDRTQDTKVGDTTAASTQGPTRSYAATAGPLDAKTGGPAASTQGAQRSYLSGALTQDTKAGDSTAASTQGPTFSHAAMAGPQDAKTGGPAASTQGVQSSYLSGLLTQDTKSGDTTAASTQNVQAPYTSSLLTQDAKTGAIATGDATQAGLAGYSGLTPLTPASIPGPAETSSATPPSALTPLLGNSPYFPFAT